MAADNAPNDEEEKLLHLVPEEGTIGNKNLRTQLGWEVERYFSVRDRLVDKGLLQIGRGQGGSVYRVAQVGARPERHEAAKRTRPRMTERDHYQPLRATLEDSWFRTLRHRNYVVQVTASQGRRRTGGKWTRPDITVVAVSTYAYVPGKFMDVITYEVKPEDQWGIEAVFEAASHSRFATYSHLLIHAPDGAQSIQRENREDLERLEAECARFNVGLALFQDAHSYDSFEFRVEAVRLHPDPEEMNKFIDTQISAEYKRQIMSWK